MRGGTCCVSFIVVEGPSVDEGPSVEIVVEVEEEEVAICLFRLIFWMVEKEM